MAADVGRVHDIRVVGERELRVSMEVAKTVLEVADVAWTAVECCHHHHHHDERPPPLPELKGGGDSDTGALRSENERLRQLLEKNLNLLQQISSSPTLLQNCPSDLHDRLLEAVNSKRFTSELESLRENSTSKFPFDEPTGADLEKAYKLVNVDHEEPSWWVWVSEEMVPINSEEESGIDNENYVIISEEHVVDGVVNFMSRCILANPKTQFVSRPCYSETGRTWSPSLEQIGAKGHIKIGFVHN
ncbi:hypothetical protein DH2020_007109 [Rehmannia glutinosa]|uniref:Uncharacterized protein n=1 Tax=Rehmannia glutinosa TaxID=99300 RepID=A0ABR0TY48_REHGL